MMFFELKQFGVNVTHFDSLNVKKCSSYTQTKPLKTKKAFNKKRQLFIPFQGVDKIPLQMRY